MKIKNWQLIKELKEKLNSSEKLEGNSKARENNIVEKENECGYSKSGICTLHNDKCQRCFEKEE